MLLWKQNSHMEKDEIKSLSLALLKNQLQVDQSL